MKLQFYVIFDMRILFLFLVLSFASHSQQDTLKVLSWNVFLRPGVLHDAQMVRVDSISAYLMASDCDVIVLQEVFHRKARKELIDNLKESYPFATERTKGSFWGVASGLIVLSKYTIIEETFVPFKKATGSDALAKKGVLRAEIQCENQKIALYGTHMQAGGGAKRQAIRQQQLDSIQAFMAKDNEPTLQLIAGDFNIRQASQAFDSITAKLNVTKPDLLGPILTTANFEDQQLMSTTGPSSWIDYIFLRAFPKASVISTEIGEPKMKVDGELRRMSDHNPIWSTVVIQREL